MSRLASAIAALLLSLAGAVLGEAGHEFPFYPSFYPHEITVEALDPRAAAARLRDGSLHAYLGADPFPGAAAPAAVARVESLDAYVVVALSPRSAFFPDRARRCLAARAVIDALVTGSTYHAHPYAVTPYHPDFFHHADLAARRSAGSWTGPPLRIRAGTALAAALVPAALRTEDPSADATVETVEVAELRSTRATRVNGWLGPPWLQAGWFHAYLLQADAIADDAVRPRVEAGFRRLTTGAYDGLAERIGLERALVGALQEGCERLVAGYTLRREHLNVDYSEGVENVARDAQTGLDTPIFPRTVKLKDFPWNGWLTVGTPAPPKAAWNPVGGFADLFGRVVWAAVGDPALLPAPHGGGWVPNRVTPALVNTDGRRVTVPDDALVPERGTGALRRVTAGTAAATHLRYRVHGSAFHDGTRMTVGDVVYPFVAAARWGAAGSAGHDPQVDAHTALLRERLVGLRVVRVETDVLAFGEDKLTYEVPVVDVWVDHRAPDPLEAAAIAPPWTSVPWHLLVLMEEAVARGLAAFSRGEADRRGVPWLDLVRDPRQQEALGRLLDDLARRGFVPDALRGYATADEARERWAALRAFRDAHGHLLVTNGPYRLTRFSVSAASLQVFRDLTYPRGVGAFDRHAIPLRAYVTRAERQGDSLVVEAEIERIERFGREHRIVRERFVRAAVLQDKRPLPICHFVVVGPDGAVLEAGAVEAVDPGTFRLAPGKTARAGALTILLALTLDDNRVDLPVKVVSWTP